VKEDKASDAKKELCLKCGRRMARDRRPGSLTTYLFGGLDCQCARAGAEALPAGADSDIEFCPRCGLEINTSSQDGSLTGYLFQSTRCKCTPDPAFAEGKMSARFWKLKEEGRGPLFESAPVEGRGSHTGAIDLIPGATVGGVYVIIRLIGRGGMGEVYLAKHTTLAKKCALKVVPPEKVTEIGWQRFQMEAKAVAKLEHINLVRVTDLGIHDGCLPYCAMDFVEGQNLAELLAGQGPMPLNAVLETFMQVCDGVECAHHSGILHRDLKPANIMLTRAPTGKLLVKVLDFGLAKLTRHDRTKQSLTAVGEVFGSPPYMSPEQCTGDRIDNRSDIYSIGCTMFECLTGRPPFLSERAQAILRLHFEADPPTLESIVGPGVLPMSMEVVVAKLLRKNPAERYQTLSQVKSDLELVAGGQDVLPVYFSRSKRPAPEAAPGTYSPDKCSNGSRPAAGPNIGLLCCVGLLFILIVGSTACFHFASPKANKINYFSKATAYRSAADIHLASAAIGNIRQLQPYPLKFVWDGKPFYKGTSRIAGIEYRIWIFPPAASEAFGLESMSPVGAKSFVLSSHKSTPVSIPRSERVSLAIKPGLIGHLDLLQGLTDGSFDELGLRVLSASECAKVASSLARFKSVTGLRIGNVEWTTEQSRSSLEVINQFPNLDRLLLSASFDGDSLAKVRRLRELQDIRLDNKQPHLHQFLKVISGSKQLRKLTVLNWSAAPNDLPLIARCQNIEKLMIGEFRGSHEQLLCLAKLHRLSQLSLPALLYRDDLAVDLKGIKLLRKLKLWPGQGWTVEQVGRLSHDLPDVKVLVSRSENEQRDDLDCP
jgi:serine/threonine protein kinase